MTRPIYEPSLTGADRKLGFSADQLFRRPAPATSGGIEVVHMYSWNYTTVNTVADTTWTSVCGLGGTDGFYESIFYTPGLSVAGNCASGVVTLGVSAEWLIQGWVVFWEDANDGEQRFVALDFGSSDRHIQEYVANANSTLELAVHLPVHTFKYGSGTVFLEVWHDHGSDLTIRDAQISVKRLVLAADGVDEAC